MMVKMGKGVRVRLTRDYCQAKAGMVGTVFEKSGRGERDIVFDGWTDGHDGNANDGSKNHHYIEKSMLELVDPAVAPSEEVVFKVGARVRVKGCPPEDIATVTARNADGAMTLRWVNGTDSNLFIWYDGELELASLVIEAGKKFVGASGVVHDVFDNSDNPFWPLRNNAASAGESTRFWKADGEAYNNGRYNPDMPAGDDLVAELVEPVAAEPWIPQAGDKVRWTEQFKASMYTKDAVYEIGRVYRDTCYVTDDDNNSDPTTTTHSWPTKDLVSHFEFVSRTPAPAVGSTVTGTVTANNDNQVTVEFGTGLTAYRTTVPTTALAA